MIRWIQDQILAFLQKRCEHSGEMVAVDILEGCAPGIRVAYCRRCGSVKTDWEPGNSPYAVLEHCWRRPDPNLWREDRFGVPLRAFNAEVQAS